MATIIFTLIIISFNICMMKAAYSMGVVKGMMKARDIYNGKHDNELDIF